jgi:hypothetical protein
MILAQMSPAERWWALNQTWVFFTGIGLVFVGVIVVAAVVYAKQMDKVFKAVLPRFQGRPRKGLRAIVDIVVDGVPAEVEWPQIGGEMGTLHVFRRSLPSDGSLKIRSGGVEGVLEKVVGLPFKVRTGDLLFDKEFLVTASDEAFAKRALTTGARLELTQLKMRFYRLILELGEGRLSVSAHSHTESLTADEIQAFIEGCGRLAAKLAS